MLPCKLRCIALIFAFLLPGPDKFKVACSETDTVWKMTGLLLHHCLRLSASKSPGPKPGQFLIVLRDCLKRRSVLVFDKILERDVIELGDGIDLVRYRKENDTGDNRAIVLSNNGPTLDETDWKSQVAQRLTELFRTHILKIQLKGLGGVRFEGRRRHKNNMMSQLFMFALIAAGVIVIPMGFQFLAILGGKALLLAKMALLMTSIQGLKKIATSNLNYGLYSTYGGQGPCKGVLSYDSDTPNIFVSLDFEDPYNHWHYDRKWPYEPEGHGDVSYSYEPVHHDVLHPRQDEMLQEKYITM